MMMLIPEAWAGNPLMDEDRRAFYEHHAADGAVGRARGDRFTDGRLIGATLDRNGLRPARYLVTRDGHVLLASETGVLDIPEEEIIEKWRLQPGRMLLIDLEARRIVSDDELKSDLARRHPYRDWLKRTQIMLRDLPLAAGKGRRSEVPLLDRQQAFGYTDIRLLMQPMAQTGQEAVGSMGTDTPISALSDRPKLLDTASSRTSPRSPTRRSIRSARSW